MTRLTSALGLFLAVAIVSAAPVPAIPADPTKDREGNPLPKGATARLGSLAFRGPSMSGLSFSPNGKTLRAIRDSDRMLVWDADTGKPLAAKSMPPIKDERITVRGAFAGDRVIWIAMPSTPRGKPGARGKQEDSTAI